ncbi:MAG TPA: DUF4142 domain-containing protein [Gemmatimonadales bacterium]|nr:DUF4142 domain-containing protein [Gemmatimonadales bacterium]
MRRHLTTASLLVASMALWAGVAAAQDTTQAQQQNPQDSSKQDGNQYNGQNNQYTQLSDNMVLMRMHRVNQMEIRVGKLVQRNASDAKVKSFGSRIVRDHQANDKKVVALAKKLGVTLGRDGMMDNERTDSTRRNDSTYSSYPRSDTTQGQYGQRDTTNGRYGQGQYQGQDATHRGDMARLSTLHGAAFDSAFANAMVQGHNRAISFLESAQNQVQQQSLKTLIASTLPTLRQHLQTAESLTNAATTTSSRQ